MRPRIGTSLSGRHGQRFWLIFAAAVVGGLESVCRGEQVLGKVVSNRYSEGLPGLDTRIAGGLGKKLNEYLDGVRDANDEIQ